MSLGRAGSRLSALASGTRSFTTGRVALAARTPALSDIEPDKGAEFDKRQQAWRQDLTEAANKRKEEQSAYPVTGLGSLRLMTCCRKG